jgi:hypothetical protein
MWTTLRLAHIPTAEQNQKKRTNNALPKPDNLIRSRQIWSKQEAIRERGALREQGAEGHRGRGAGEGPQD